MRVPQSASRTESAERGCISELLPGDDAELPVTLEHDRGDGTDLTRAALPDRLFDVGTSDPLASQSCVIHLPVPQHQRGRGGRELADAARDRRSERDTACNRSSSESATIPSTNATSEVSRIVASVDPSATVTMRSKALSCARVRLPEMRIETTRNA